MADSGNSDETEEQSVLQVVARRKVAVAVPLIVVLGLAIVYTTFKSPTFTATATVLVPQQQAAAALNVQNAQLQNSESLQRYLSDEQQFAEGDAVRQAARKKLGFNPSVNVGTSTTADVLTFTAHSGNRAATAHIANTYANSYINQRQLSQVQKYADQVTALQESILNLKAKQSGLAPTDPQRSALQLSIDALTQSAEQTQAATQLTTAQLGPSVVRAAVTPKSPSSPQKKLDWAIGALMGLALGVGLAFLRERFDDAINSRESAEQAARTPVIGIVPLVPSWRRASGQHVALFEDAHSAVSESYRTLRTSLEFLDLDLEDPRKILAVTSSLPGEGKTTTVANLAVAFARAGRRVSVVSCDLRRPQLHHFFKLPNSVGITSVLLGQASLDQALVSSDMEPLLTVLPAGPIPPNPAEILAMERTREVIRDIATIVDVVLLDCPPVLPVSDALEVGRLADGVLIVGGAGSTSVRDLKRTAQLLRQVQAKIVGVALNRVPHDRGAAYGYSYGYGYGYDYDSNREESTPSTGRIAGDRRNEESPAR